MTADTTTLPVAAPCEHCGSTDIFIEREDLSAYQARCNDCGSRGPIVEEGQYYDDEEAGQRDATIAWNRRAAPSSLTAPEREHLLSRVTSELAEFSGDQRHMTKHEAERADMLRGLADKLRGGVAVAPVAAEGWRYFNDDRVRLSDGTFGIVTGRGRDGLLRIRPETKPDWNSGDLTSASDDDLDAWRGAPKPLEFGYTNWRGEFSRRRAQPIRLYFGSTEWHPEPQWLLEATDLDKGEVRAFAVKDMMFGAQPAQPDAEERGVTEATLDRVRQFVGGMADLPDERTVCVMTTRDDDEPSGCDDPSPLTLGDLRALSAARASAPAAPEVVEKPILWCVHHIGPDDLHPVEDYEAAVKMADAINDQSEKFNFGHKPDSINYVYSRAYPAIWTGTPESHAEWLEKRRSAALRDAGEGK